MYSDISESIQAGNSNIEIRAAYIENSMVFINLALKAGANGTMNFSITDNTLFPRATSLGIYGAPTQAEDSNKMRSATISNTGSGSIWLSNALAAVEYVTFLYPLKES